MTSSPDLYKMYQAMERDHIILSFKGNISPDLLTSMYQIMESRLQSIGENPQKMKKVYHILVELLQNIFHHMDELLEEDKDPDVMCKDAMFMIIRDEDGMYFIHTGNFILNSKCDKLKSRIEQINTMSPQELRAYYVDTLNTTEFSEKGGAGLGIIDIARKSGNRLAYSFNRVTDKYSFFSLVVNIS
jgi:hypothetical protein